MSLGQCLEPLFISCEKLNKIPVWHPVCFQQEYNDTPNLIWSVIIPPPPPCWSSPSHLHLSSCLLPAAWLVWRSDLIGQGVTVPTFIIPWKFPCLYQKLYLSKFLDYTICRCINFPQQIHVCIFTQDKSTEVTPHIKWLTHIVQPRHSWSDWYQLGCVLFPSVNLRTII